MAARYICGESGLRAGAHVKTGDRVNVVLAAWPANRQAAGRSGARPKANPAASTRWEELSFTHRKEYVSRSRGQETGDARAGVLQKPSNN
jgi:hypothetical protein